MGAIFEKQSQDMFFISLGEMLEDVATKIELDGRNSRAFRTNVMERIEEIRKSYDNQILVGDEANMVEKMISETLSDYALLDKHYLGESFAVMQNYVKSSGCKTAKNGFTTREEVDKTNAAMAEIKEVCGYCNAVRVQQEFHRLSEDTQRQLMCMMESALLHPKHEHIISQFDCDVESYRNMIDLFKIAQQLPQFHDSIPLLKQHYDAKSKEVGFDIYPMLFSSSGINTARDAYVEVSILTEDAQTIPQTAEFTYQMLNDPKIFTYIVESGGLLRQTRSNSDGSKSLGAHKTTIEYLKTDIAVQEMVEDSNLQIKILQGAGYNDIERMGPWLLGLMSSDHTAQGADMQHKTLKLISDILAKDKDVSQKRYLELRSKYTEEEISTLTDFYYQAHLNSEFGIPMELDGKPIYSGNLVHRGIIQDGAVKKLGNLSSRPDNRGGETKAAALQENTPNTWGKAVFNNDMRRIGEISSQRISGISTFLLAIFYKTPKASSDLVAEYSAIPAIRNSNMSAIFALGVADLRTFALTNGFTPEELEKDPEKNVKATAKTYSEFLRIKQEENPERAMEFAKTNGFSEAKDMRHAHMCYQMEGCRNVLRNAVTPLIHNSSPEIKEKAEKIFAAAESGDSIKRYDEYTKELCGLLREDPALDIDTKRTLVCISQKISDVTKKGNYYDTRAALVVRAHQASKDGDKAAFDKACTELAMITRSAGNPISAGQKTHEMFATIASTVKELLISAGDALDALFGTNEKTNQKDSEGKESGDKKRSDRGGR